MDRTRAIIKTSIVGILANFFLSAFKLVVGITANSVSITMDAVNNISDALSSIITIIGAKLSVRTPDRKHPFGYGRIEALSALIIGMMIFYAGLTAIRESVQRIIHPEATEYSTEAFIVMGAAIVIKILMGVYTRHRGHELESKSLIASGKDALDDSILTVSTLVAALIYIYSDVNIEAYVGAVIALLIVRTGYETLKSTISELLGERISPELAHSVKQSILSFPEVEGVYDLVIHNYGREIMVGSTHIEISDALRAPWIDNLQRSIADKVYMDTGVDMMGITIYAINSRNEKAIEMRQSIRKITEKYEHVLQMHGFYLDEVDKAIRFDIVVSFDADDENAIRDSIRKETEELYPGYEVSIIIDHDIA